MANPSLRPISETTSATLPDEFTQRAYQDEMVERALTENIVCALGTGTGKTYIAVRLIQLLQHEIAGDWDGGGKYAKRTVFVVPSVPLVEQQSKVLRELTGLPTGEFSGDKGVDEWTPEEWKTKFGQFKILVMVHDIFKNLLANAILEPDRISVVILDECHHAAENHPYREIMRLLHWHPKGRTRILGLTASVINIKLKKVGEDQRLRKLEDHIRDLENCLGCVVWTSLDDSLKDHGARPDPEVVQFSAPLWTVELEELSKVLTETTAWLTAAKNQTSASVAGKIEESAAGIEKADDKAKEWIRELTNDLDKIIRTLTSLGPFCAYKTSMELLKDIREMRRLGVFRGDSIVPVQVTLTSLQVFGVMLETVFKVASVKPDHFSQLWPLMTPKVKKLIELLELSWQSTTDTEEEKFCCIVFIKERIQAWALHNILQLLSSSPDGRYSFIKSGFCVGQLTKSGSADSTGKKPSNSAIQLRTTLKRFRDGQCNVLVATDVVEEGFDVPRCNLILRMDPPQTYRSYVQSKGRARAKDSKFIMMVEKKDYEAFVENDLQEFKVLDETMKNYCYGRSGPTLEDRREHFSDEAYPAFCPPGTNATITLDTALITLQRYCNTLPNDNMASCTVYMKKDECGGGYLCTAYLPLSAAIKEPVKSEVMTSFLLAKKVAAMKCCQLLFEANELDPVYLLPMSEERWQKDVEDFIGAHQREQVLEGCPRPGTRKRLQSYPMPASQCFQSYERTAVLEPHFLYAICFKLKGHLKVDKEDRFEYDQTVTVGLVSPVLLPVLPEWSIYIRLREYSVHLDLITAFSPTADSIGKIKKCHFAIFDDVVGFAKVMEGLASLQEAIGDTLFAVPMKMAGGGYILDWAALDRLIIPHQFDSSLLSDQQRKLRGVQAENYEDAVVACNYQGVGEERFYVMKIRQDLTPHSLPQNKTERTAEYLLRKNNITVQLAEQPMLDVRYCSKGLNFLRPKPLETSNGRTLSKLASRDLSEEAHMQVVPELCKILPLTSVLYFKCRLLPSVLYRIQSFCNTLQLYQSLKSRTEIGIAIQSTVAVDWQPLQNDHRFRGLYTSLPRDSSTSNPSSTFSINQESRQEMITEDIVGQFVQTNPDNSISSRPPASHPVHHSTPEIISSEACSVPLPESVGLFFEKYQKAEFYKDLKRRIKERNEEETLERLSGDSQTRPMTVPLSPSQTALWTAAPPGCQSHLLQPPFLLDASFETDPRRSPFPEITSLLTALTTAKAGDSFDLERLETIGDSFLKMTTCLYLHQKYPAYHEGRLSFLKDQQISNYNLYRLGKELGLPAFVINQVLEPLVNFTPPGYKALGERGLVELNDKGLADVVEAIIGMILMECGSASALTLMTSLGLKVELEKGFSGEKSPLLRNDPGVKEELRQLTAGFDAFEEHIGYKFRQQAYLLQAFTHSSFTGNRITDCYQRLEFIGDAILDFLVTRYLYSDQRCLSPGQLTDLRQALVNNKTFSLLAAQHNFHNNIKYCSVKIFKLIRQYVEEAGRADSNIAPITDDMMFFETYDDDEEESYAGYERAEDPKTLGDVFESVAGAIFLDSDFSLDAVWRVYYNLMKNQIEYCVEKCPKNPIRVMYEVEPGHVAFHQAEILPNGKVRVAVEVMGRGTFMGIGNNHRTAKCSAAKKALMELSNTTVTS